MPEVKVRGATTEQEALGLLRSREVVGVVRGGRRGSR
jgi:hypothetical protein